MMKKLLLGIGALIIVVIVAWLVLLGNITSSVVQSAINTYGPKMTGTSVSVENVSIQPYIGYGEIKGLKVGNPAGYSAPNVFTFESVSLSLELRSLLSGEVIIDEINIIKPTFFYERKLLTSNVAALRQAIKANTTTTDKAVAAEASSQGNGEEKTFVVKKVVLTGGVIHLGVLGQSGTVDLPEIKLNSLGSKGITAVEMTNKVMQDVLSQVMVAATELAVKAVEDPVGTTQGVADSTLKAADDVVDSVTNAVQGLWGGSDATQ